MENKYIIWHTGTGCLTGLAGLALLFVVLLISGLWFDFHWLADVVAVVLGTIPFAFAKGIDRRRLEHLLRRGVPN